MDNCYTGTMLLRAAEDEALKGFELRDGFGADEIDFPLNKPLAENKAREICEAMLRLDREKMITGVRAEKYTYDRIKSAYKVMMRFFLRECIGTAEEAVV